ncbi:uroporphyrinogen-III C-methyltransferase [Litorilituus lipolyticus]|uniref:Heme biosynthesis operon protein HemX n=1 Tax=Litorilituus lipolyticus TaxID=2491017 RepID=A0A502L5S8_9GAMM|nr:uroporphyrinogen-III C-methyltransferase [Litorilituus lipolyticus]TPH15677.1 heme biosynthesis operon protein HemX [Litorilituus lipolyticus]
MSKKKIPQSKTNMTKKDTTNTDAEHSSTDTASPVPDNSNSLAASIETNKMTSEKDANKTHDTQTEDDKLASLEKELSDVKKPEPANNKATSKNKTKTNSKSKVNSEIKNTAVNTTTAKAKGSNTLSAIALVIACLSIAASAGHYFWQQQQSTQTLSDFKAQNDSVIATSEHKIKQAVTTQLKQALLQQQQAFSAELQQKTAQADKASQQEIAKLTQEINQLETRLANRQPSDWLIHEAEYLIRIAARTMWLEKDTKAAVGLLNDADKRLNELDNPAFLPVRELIHQDIKRLELMPTLQTQEAVLSLMALNKQSSDLPLAGVDLGESLTQEQNFELSDDINDWQENLKKTYQKFLSDFITVRRRTGMVEPLMAPEQQQHLKQNLSLKVQLALWAASQKKTEIYQQTLSDIQLWLNEFFDMQAPINQKFSEALTQLKTHTIHYDYPNNLASLSALTILINEQNSSTLPAVKQEEATPVIEASGDEL